MRSLARTHVKWTLSPYVLLNRDNRTCYTHAHTPHTCPTCSPTPPQPGYNLALPKLVMNVTPPPPPPPPPPRPTPTPPPPGPEHGAVCCSAAAGGVAEHLARRPLAEAGGLQVGGVERWFGFGGGWVGGWAGELLTEEGEGWGRGRERGGWVWVWGRGGGEVGGSCLRAVTGQCQGHGDAGQGGAGSWGGGSG